MDMMHHSRTLGIVEMDKTVWTTIHLYVPITEKVNSNCDLDFDLLLATGNNIFCQKMSVSVDGNFLYSVIGLYIIVAKVRKT